MAEPRIIKVRVILDVTIPVKDWEANYGTDDPADVEYYTKDHTLELVNQDLHARGLLSSRAVLDGRSGLRAR